MIIPFEYDGLEYRGRSLYVRGTVEIAIHTDKCSSEMGNRLVSQEFQRHEVIDFWVDYLEDIHNDIPLELDSEISEVIQEKLDSEDLSYRELLDNEKD